MKRINSRVNSLLVLPCLLPLHSPGEEEPGGQGKELTPELFLCWCFPASCLSSPLLKETSIRPTMEKSFVHQEKRNQGTKEKELTPELILCWCFPASCLSSPLLKDTSIRPTMEKSFIHQEKRNQGIKEKN